MELYILQLFGTGHNDHIMFFIMSYVIFHE
jgi:hypothetical protein